MQDLEHFPWVDQLLQLGEKQDVTSATLVNKYDWIYYGVVGYASATKIVA